MQRELTGHEVKVSVMSPVYNQADIVRSCLDGIVNQRTDFAFELLVHDDASIDGTADIIREYAARYPQIVRPVLQTENQYSKGVLIGKEFLYPIARGEYVALCDGDDCWTDPLKLQKQVDYLDSHPECGLVYGRVNMVDAADGSFICEWGDECPSLHSLIERNVVPAMTAMFRRALWDDYQRDVNPEQYHWLMGDYPLWLYLAGCSSLHCFPEVMGRYSVSRNSMSHFPDPVKQERFNVGTMDVQYYFAERYSTPDPAWLPYYYLHSLRLAVVEGREADVQRFALLLKQSLPGSGRPLDFKLKCLLNCAFPAVMQRLSDKHKHNKKKP